MLERGTDLSGNNPPGVDFQAMKQAGITFLIAKASESDQTDANFNLYIQNAAAAGLKTLAYHFLVHHAVKPIDTQVNHFLEVTNGKVILRAIDLEKHPNITAPYNQPTKEDARQALDLLAQGSGHRPLVYTSSGFWLYQLGAPAWGYLYYLWLAHYTSYWFKTPKPWAKPVIWQDTSAGEIAGYPKVLAYAKTCDLDWYLGGIEEWQD